MRDDRAPGLSGSRLGPLALARGAGSAGPGLAGAAVTGLLEQLAELVAGKLQERVAPPAAVPELIGRVKLAETLGCSLPTVDKLTREGLPHIRVGDSPRYRLEEVLAHLHRGGPQ